jgi:adenosylcobinamide-phosphate synthase
VAENLSDGVLGPWLAYAALGLPGAVAYRAVNTLDSMWGYRTEAYVELGWAAARLDDLANLAPARLTALAIAVAAGALHEDGAGALEAWRCDAGVTESPNAGHPMAAMAGALGVRLTKRGTYTLGAGLREPGAEDIGRAIRLARGAAVGAAVMVTLALLRPGCAR